MRRTLIVLLAALLCTGAAMAVETQLQLTNQYGDAIINCTATIEVNDTKWASLLPDGSGFYTIDVEVGEKLAVFLTDDAGNDYDPAGKVIDAEDLELGINLVVNELLTQHLCPEALPIALAPGGQTIVGGSTVGQPVDPSVSGQTCGTLVNTGGVWYTIQGTGNTVTVSTCNDADYDTKLSVWCNDCANLNAATCIAGNDDSAGCAGFTSEVSFPTHTLSEYAILVHGFNGAQGNFNLTVTDSGSGNDTPDQCVPPPPPTPVGACCNCLAEPFNCTIGTSTECDALTGNLAGTPGIGFQGDGTQCSSLGMNQFDFIRDENQFIDGTATLSGVINVPDSFLVGDLNVPLSISHTWTGDLTVSLVSPDGTMALLVDQPGVPTISGCGCSGDDMNVVLDDSAAGSIEDDHCVQGGVNIDGTYAPSPDALAVFNGQSASGDWTMLITDEEPTFDTGTWNSWGLSFTDGAPLCTEFTGGGPGPGPGDEDEDESDDTDWILENEGQLGGSDGLLDLSFSADPNGPARTTAVRERENVRSR